MINSLHIILSYIFMNILYRKTKKIYFCIIFVLMLGTIKEISDLMNTGEFGLIDMLFNVIGIILFYVRIECININE